MGEGQEPGRHVHRSVLGLGDGGGRGRDGEPGPDVLGDLDERADGYPITCQSFILVYQKQASADKAAALQEWLGYLSATARSCSQTSTTRRAGRDPDAGAGATDEDRQLGWTSSDECDHRATSSERATQPTAPRPLGDRIFAIAAAAAGLLVLVILVLIALSTGNEARPWFEAEGLTGFFTNNWDPASGHVRCARVHLRHRCSRP